MRQRNQRTALTTLVCEENFVDDGGVKEEHELRIVSPEGVAQDADDTAEDAEVASVKDDEAEVDYENEDESDDT